MKSLQGSLASGTKTVANTDARPGQQFGSGPTEPDPRHPHDDITEALRASPAAHSKFAALPLSHKTEYLKWIGEAKKPTTRARRITGMIEKLNIL
jgi:hypothetical protein